MIEITGNLSHNRAASETVRQRAGAALLQHPTPKWFQQPDQVNLKKMEKVDSGT